MSVDAIRSSGFSLFLGGRPMEMRKAAGSCGFSAIYAGHIDIGGRCCKVKSKEV